MIKRSHTKPELYCIIIPYYITGIRPILAKDYFLPVHYYVTISTHKISYEKMT